MCLNNEMPLFKTYLTQIMSYIIIRFLSEVSAKAERQGRERFLHFI